MPAFFVDSSALVKRYVSEAGSHWVNNLLHPASGNDVYAARIVGPEVVAAIARRARLGDITQQESAAAIRQFRVELNARFQIIELTSGLAEAAMNLAVGR